VGLEVHEDPRLARSVEGSLEAENTVSVEPGIYLPERFGVRIEDLVVVADAGCRSLTAFPKELVTVA
jgi:Xaa-Pro aminopeptidase